MCCSVETTETTFALFFCTYLMQRPQGFIVIRKIWEKKHFIVKTLSKLGKLDISGGKALHSNSLDINARTS